GGTDADPAWRRAIDDECGALDQVTVLTRTAKRDWIRTDFDLESCSDLDCTLLWLSSIGLDCQRRARSCVLYSKDRGGRQFRMSAHTRCRARWIEMPGHRPGPNRSGPCAAAHVWHSP